MEDSQKIDAILGEAKTHALRLMNTAPVEQQTSIGTSRKDISSWNKQFPETGGVYLIHKKEEGILYIGKAKNLQRRICTDHLSREKRDSMSAFRRSVHKTYGKLYGKEMREWIFENCTFSFLEIPDADVRSLVEALLIVSCRTKLLLNKP